MSRKKLFVLSTVFMLLMILLVFVLSRTNSGPEAEIAGIYNDDENQSTYHQANGTGEDDEPSNQPVPQTDEPGESDDPDTAEQEPDSNGTPPEPAPENNENEPTQSTPHGYIAMRHIRYLNDNFYSRFPFSYQEKRAAVWIAQELLAMGYTQDDIYVQEFSLDDVIDFMRWGRDALLRSHAVYHNYDYFRDTYLSQNVILTVPGQSSQVIVVGAHYDTVLYPGASDNASGTALLLESAQRMRYIDNYYTIVYVFFGAEEVGLLGAHYYLNSLSEEELDNIIFMVNADVLFEGPYFIYGGGYLTDAANRTVGANAITRQWDDIAYELTAREGISLHADPSSVFLSSDQRVFLDAGFTVMMLFGTYFHRDGSFDFRVFHSYRDCYHYITARWPYKMNDAMRTFSLFLEEVLLARY